MKQYMCVICGYIYDEAVGDTHSNIVPGTLWDDIPDDWVCPDCQMAKADFVMMEI